MAKIFAVYQLPVSLRISNSNLGKTFQVKIAGKRGRVLFPDIESNGWRVTAPRLNESIDEVIKNYVEGVDHGWERPDYWGEIEEDADDYLLNAILLEFPTSSSSVQMHETLPDLSYAIGVEIDSLFEQVDAWFDLLRSWVEIVFNQDANPDNPLSRTQFLGKGLHLWVYHDGKVTLPTTAEENSVDLSFASAITVTKLRKIFKFINDGKTPSEARLLLRDAASLMRRGHYRRSVLDIGTALEITLANYNNYHLKINTPVNGATLGWYVNQPRIAQGAKLTTDTYPYLVRVRNEAIHKNKTPTYGQAIKAYDICIKAVDELDPLPI